ncbi:hypothetical protein HG530_001280 [Fusarium avenaceum]|nr:hypothetical protein HG530_001280 [Fusarium avenaceum]
MLQGHHGRRRTGFGGRRQQRPEAPVEVIERALLVHGERTGQLLIVCGDAVYRGDGHGGAGAPADEALVVVACGADFGASRAGGFGEVAFDAALFARPAGAFYDADACLWRFARHGRVRGVG